MADSQEFGDLISQYLLDRDRSASWLARRLEISPSTVSKWQSADSRPKDPNVVIRIADVLGIHDVDKRKELLDAAGYVYKEASLSIDAAPDEPPVDDVKREKQMTATAEGPHPPSSSSETDAQPIKPASFTALWKRLTKLLHDRWRGVLPTPLRRVLLWRGYLVGVGMLTVLVLAILWGWGQSWRPARGADNVRLLITLPEAYSEEESVGQSESSTALTTIRNHLVSKLGGLPRIQIIDREGILSTFSDTDPAAAPPIADADVVLVLDARGDGDAITIVTKVLRGDGVLLLASPLELPAPPVMQAIDTCLLELSTEMATAILSALIAELREFGLSRRLLRAETLDTAPTQQCDALLLNNEGALLFRDNQVAEAAAKFRAAIALDNDYADAHNNLGRALREEEKFDEAIAQFQVALSKPEADPRYRFNLAVAYTLSEQYDDAIREYLQAIDEDPAFAEAKNNLGYTYLEVGELDLAEAQLLDALADQPPSPLLNCVHKNLGRLHFLRGDNKLAAGDLELAIGDQVSPCYAEALHYLAQAYHALELTDAACDILFDYAFVAGIEDTERANDASEFFSAWGCG